MSPPHSRLPLHRCINVWFWHDVRRATGQSQSDGVPERGTQSLGVIERDGYDTDSFVDAWEVTAKFPDLEGLDRDSASEFEIQTGLLSEFIKRTSYLFYTHLEPKHPDKYNPKLDPDLDL